MVVRHIKLSAINVAELCDNDICDGSIECKDCPWYDPHEGDVIILEVI